MTTIAPVRAVAVEPDVARWREEIVDEGIRISYSHLASISVGSFLTSSAIGLITWGLMPHTRLLAWLGAVWANALARVFLARAFHARPRDRAELRRWGSYLTAALTAASVIYSSVLFLPVGEPSFLLIATVALAIGGTIAGANLALAGTPRALAGAVIALSVPLLGVALFQGPPETRELMLMFASFLLMSVVTGRRNHATLVTSIALRYQNVELAEQLATQNAAEADARRAAENAARDKTRFLAAASHDLRQPLHALSLFACALGEEPQSARGAHLLARIETSMEALQQLLDGLLDISRLDAGVVVAKRRRFAAAALAHQIESLFGEPARQRGLRLRIMPSDLWIDADPDMTAQALRNLVANAIRYTPRGGIVVAFRRRGDKVRIQCWDSGIGIPEDQRREIFREFHQLGNPERDRSRGVGLGLAIVERLARLLDTRVEVRSRVGHGSVFWFDVPAAPPGEVVERIAVPPPIRTGRMILVVDDDALAREGLRAALEAWGYHVLAASTPSEAGEIATRNPAVEAVICDFRLPEHQTAIHALAAIATGLGRTPPAVILTGETDPARIRQAHDTGHTVLHKPVPPDRLRTVLAGLGERRPA